MSAPSRTCDTSDSDNQAVTKLGMGTKGSKPAASKKITAQGVSIKLLSELEAYVTTHLGRNATTSEALKCLGVKDSSEQHVLSLADYIGKSDAAGNPYLGPATVYVSHTWEQNFADAVQTMRNYAENHSKSMFFLDLSCNGHRSNDQS